MQLANLILRGIQAVFLAIVLGLSAELIKSQTSGGSPAITNFALVCGIFGAIAMIVGFVSAFVASLQGIVMLALDGLATLFFLAGSVARAVKLGVHSCHNTSGYTAYNGIINGGAIRADANSPSGFGYYKDTGYYTKRCQEAQALDAFLFFALVAFIASLVYDGVVGFRRGKSSRVDDM